MPKHRRIEIGIRLWPTCPIGLVHQTSTGSKPSVVQGEKEALAKILESEVRHRQHRNKVVVMDDEQNINLICINGVEQRQESIVQEKQTACKGKEKATYAMGNGDGTIMQLDSSKEQISGESGAKNIGQNVESAENSCIAISHSKKKNSIETPKRNYRTKNPTTSDDLRKLCGLKRSDAANARHVTVSTFKCYYRKNGIKWWNGDGCSFVEPKLLNSSVHQNSSGSKPPEVQGEKEISTLLGARQDAVTIKAKSGEGILKFQLSSESHFAELQEAVAKRLKSKAFIIEYEDEDQEPIMIACDENWQACVKFFGNQVIRLAIRDKISLLGNPT